MQSRIALATGAGIGENGAMRNKPSGSLLRQVLSLIRHHRRSMTVDNSYAGEYRCLKNILGRLGLDAGYVVDVAASDGVTQSCTLDFFRDPNWRGLAVEMDPEKFSKLAFIYSRFRNARLARARVTPMNIADLLRGFEIPPDFTLFNLDIDSYDLQVVDALLKTEFKPKIISMEINEKIPPPIFFAVNYDDAHYWAGDHFYGCSLTAASSTVKAHGYILESLQYNNAFFVRSDVAESRLNDMPDTVAYDSGYRNKSDRRELFPWNSNVDCLLTYKTSDSIDFLNDLFKSYANKYSLHQLDDAK